MLNFQKLPIYFVLLSIPFLGFFFDIKPERSPRFHTEEEIKSWDIALSDPLFLTSDRCQQCHGTDTAGIASITLEGEDINLYDDWKTTLMANSAKDPFWRAKVSHEIIVNPVHQNIIEDKCTSCHAPMGHYNSIHNQQDFYTINDMLADTIGLDGVGCLACHQQSDTLLLGSNHSGHLFFDTAKVSYGPFLSPLESPMLNATAYKPVYSEHISDAGLCAGCHTLVTETFDLAGDPTGNTFVEQATYHEWLNSIYEPQETSCQNCHMPALEGEYILIAGFETAPRSPFYLHELVGGNTMMLGLMKDNKENLGIEASDESFDETIDATFRMLQQKTLNLNVEFVDRTEDTCYIALDLKNKAGHKFPTGYPARRTFISLVVKNLLGDTLFHSGKMDQDFRLIDLDSPYEPHHQVITEEGQIQIYEMVIADVAGNPTTVLDRAASLLKDNRLVPEGFTTSHAVYDTTELAGLVLADPDFNNKDNVEGSGDDRIYYNIPMDGNVEELEITATVYYQSVPEEWLDEMFGETSPEIEVFKTMYLDADRSPALVEEVSLEVDEIMTEVEEQLAAKLFVKIAQLSSNEFLVRSTVVHDLSAYDLNGRKVKVLKNKREDYRVFLPAAEGMYFLHFVNEKGETQIEKIMVY